MGRETLGQAVDSSAIVRMPGNCRCVCSFSSLSEADGLQVLAPAELVGQPVARLAAVVEIEHRGHGVDPQAVDVVLVEPEQGVGDEEVADLVAAVVEDQRAPVAMLAAAGIGMLVQGRAVELPQAVAVAGEVGGHPVEDHADVVLVADDR